MIVEFVFARYIENNLWQWKWGLQTSSTFIEMDVV